MMALDSLRRVARSAPGETIRKAVRLVGEQTGIIRLVYENPGGPGVPALFGYGSVLADTTQYGLASSESLNGSTSAVREQALAGALGEAVERYAARFVPEEELVTAPWRELGGDALDPRSLVLYSAAQYERPGFPYAPVTGDTVLRWVRGYSLTRRTPVLVPAFAVFMPYPYGPGERPVAEQTTNGLACGNTLEEAVLSGLCEVVERHAAMAMWLTSASLPHLDVRAADDPLLARTLRLFDRVPYELFLLDASDALHIPAVISVALDRSGRGPAATFASAAGVSPAAAVVGALEELAQCFLWLKSLMARRRARPAMDSLSTVEDHVFWATSTDRLEPVEFVVAGSGRRGLAELPDLAGADVLASIEACVDRLAGQDLEVLAVEVTPPDIAEAGLHVARVLVPGCQPLCFGAGLDRISPRLPLTGAPNAWPHPFP